MWLCAAAVGPVVGCGSGSWGFLTRRSRVLRRVPKILCIRAVRAAWAFLSVRMAGCRRSPCASARTWWIAVFDNTPAVIGLAVGPACMAGPFARSLVDSLRGRGGSGGMPGPGVAPPPFPVAGGSRGPGSAAPVRRDVGGGCWIFFRVGHHGLLRLAPTLERPLHVPGRLTPSPVVCPVDGRCWSVLRGRAFLGCTRESFWARLARPGSSWLVADSAACGVTFIVRSSRGRRRSPVRPVVSPLAHGRRGNRAARVRLRVAAAGPVAGCGLGPWGTTHALQKGAAEGTEDFVHKGHVRHLGLRLSADGGLQLLAQRQRPDLVDREDGAQVGRSGGLCRPFRDGLQGLSAVEVEPPGR